MRGTAKKKKKTTKKNYNVSLEMAGWLGLREYKGANGNSMTDMFIIMTLVMVPLRTRVKIHLTFLINAVYCMSVPQ